MATQICPKCKKDSFTWSMDDEISDLTIWGCYKCFYQAHENEADERYCSKCGKKSESKLKDSEKEYWWCSNCNTTVIIKTAPNTV
jgi:DNA-directed RNA polymerase subunit RPC12/RpoP